MEIRVDDLTSPEIIALLQEHLDSMRQFSPACSVHALDLERLRQPDITFWTAWESGELLGCGALKEYAPGHGEVKSMRTATRHLRKGVAAEILAHILAECRRREYIAVSLETGSGAPFAPAHRLYERAGFERCGPFGDYRADSFSVFMTLPLAAPHTTA